MIVDSDHSHARSTTHMHSPVSCQCIRPPHAASSTPRNAEGGGAASGCGGGVGWWSSGEDQEAKEGERHGGGRHGWLAPTTYEVIRREPWKPSPTPTPNSGPPRHTHAAREAGRRSPLGTDSSPSSRTTRRVHVSYRTRRPLHYSATRRCNTHLVGSWIHWIVWWIASK
jgi:hypothetical protein